MYKNVRVIKDKKKKRHQVTENDSNDENHGTKEEKIIKTPHKSFK